MFGLLHNTRRLRLHLLGPQGFNGRVKSQLKPADFVIIDILVVCVGRLGSLARLLGHLGILGEHVLVQIVVGDTLLARLVQLNLELVNHLHGHLTAANVVDLDVLHHVVI